MLISDKIMLNICRYLTPVHILQQLQAWNLTFMTKDAVNFGRLIITLTFSLFTHTKQNLLFNWALGTAAHTHTHTLTLNTLHSVLLRPDKH